MNFKEYIKAVLKIIHKQKLNPKEFLLTDVYHWYNIGCLPAQTVKFMK